MPVVSIHDLAIEQDDLVAATYGRSFWILDDVTPLRQISTGMAARAAHLFAPRTAIRVRRDENQDTPLPPEVPAGNNPPDGAIINYYLAPNFSGEVQVEIRDASGNRIHSYSSAPIPKEEGELPFVAEYWLAHPQPLSKSPGMHRFAWNLRYTDPQAVHAQSPYNYPIAAIVGSTPLPPEGPLVLPGPYKVRLTAGALEGEATPLLETPKGMSLMAVNDSLTALMALVDGADFAPSEQSFAAFRRVCQGWKEEIADWRELKIKDVEALNTLLGKNNLAPVASMPAVAADISCGN